MSNESRIFAATLGLVAVLVASTSPSLSAQFGQPPPGGDPIPEGVVEYNKGRAEAYRWYHNTEEGEEWREIIIVDGCFGTCAECASEAASEIGWFPVSEDKWLGRYDRFLELFGCT